MQKINDLLDFLQNRFFSSAYQLQRIVILTAIALVVGLVSFGSYYYYDRYYTNQKPAAEVSVADAEKAVRDNPNSPEARIALAETYMTNGRFEDALSQANKVSSVQPDNQHAWLVIGISYANLGKPAEAVEPLTKFIDARKDEEMPGLDRQLQAAAYYLGDSYLQLNKPQEAVAPLESAVNWSKTDADSMYKLGMAYVGIKEYEKSVNMFHGATTFVPNFLEAYEAMAGAYDAMQKPELANYARGMIAYSKKDYATALHLLLKSAQTKADFAPTFTGLGLTYEAMGDLKNAKTSYDTAVMLDPNNFTAKNGSQRVEASMKK